MDELRELLKARPLPGPRWNLDAAVDLREHLVWMRMKGRADRTLVCRRRAVVLLAEWLRRDPADATHDELCAYQLHLAARSQNNSQWQVKLLRPYFAWLYVMGRRSDDPCALVPLATTPRGLPRPMSEARVMTMIAEAPVRLLPWLILAAWCGLRACEVAALRVPDFTLDRDGQPVVYVRGKGGRHREVPVPGWAWPIITATLAESGPCWRKVRGFGSVTPELVSDACNRYLHRIGIPDTLHSLRHRAATLVLRERRDIRLVQDFLGHASLATTQIYTKVESAELAAAVNALPAPPDLPDIPGLTRPGAVALRVVDDTAHGGTA